MHWVLAGCVVAVLAAGCAAEQAPSATTQAMPSDLPSDPVANDPTANAGGFRGPPFCARQTWFSHETDRLLATGLVGVFTRTIAPPRPGLELDSAPHDAAYGAGNWSLLSVYWQGTGDGTSDANRTDLQLFLSDGDSKVSGVLRPQLQAHLHAGVGDAEARELWMTFAQRIFDADADAVERGWQALRANGTWAGGGTDHPAWTGSRMDLPGWRLRPGIAPLASDPGHRTGGDEGWRFTYAYRSVTLEGEAGGATVTLTSQAQGEGTWRMLQQEPAEPQQVARAWRQTWTLLGVPEPAAVHAWRQTMPCYV